MVQPTTPKTTPTAVAPKKGRLRELGVYSLPDGREFVASTVYSEGCCLYTPPAWALFAGPELRVGTQGQLLRRGLPTRWNVYDLRDTGRTAQYPAPVIA